MRVLDGAGEGLASNRLQVIDELRGVSALVVVLHHIFLSYSGAFGAIDVLEPVFWLGQNGVWLFIVISGFCIHLRFAKTLAEGHPEPPTFVPFWKRRLRRLYPAYFASLLLYAALSWADGSITFNGFFAYDFSMHVLLIHNLDPKTVYGIGAIFWTLALEEHLYLAYFLLVGMRRRFGWRLILVVCLGVRVLGLATHSALHHFYGWESAFRALFVAQWFVWALGALSAEAYLGVVKLPKWCRDRRIAFGLLGLTAAVITIERTGVLPALVSRAWWAVRDPVLGLGFFVLVNCLILVPSTRPRSSGWLSKALASLGVISYSLYLVHQAIVLHIAPFVLATLGLPAQIWVAPVLVVSCIGFAWIFFNLFEKPFLSPSAKAAP